MFILVKNIKIPKYSNIFGICSYVLYKIKKSLVCINFTLSHHEPQQNEYAPQLLEALRYPGCIVISNSSVSIFILVFVSVFL